MFVPDISNIVARVDGDKPDFNPYGYQVTEWIAALYVGLFGLSTVLHFGEALYSRRWYLIPSLVLGGCGEILGWSARLWSSLNITNIEPFTIQISTTIIAPTFLAAANFIILGEIINRAGPQYSRLSAKLYSTIFISIDVVALVIQAVGGGLASAASNKINGNPNNGGHVMLVGIVIQMVEIMIYSILAGEFFSNYAKRKIVRPHATPNQAEFTPSSQDNFHGSANTSAETSRVHTPTEKGTYAGGHTRMTTKEAVMSVGLAFSTLCLFVRAIYRVIELGDGWSGRIIHTQVYFNVMDAAMVVLSMYTLNFLHPSFLLDRKV